VPFAALSFAAAPLTYWQPGTICWYEVPCTDPDRAFAFYKNVFAWEAAPGAEDAMPGYMEGVESVHMFRKGNLYGAFVKMSTPEGVAAVADSTNIAKIPILASLKVEDVDKTTADVEKNGGKVHMCVTLPEASGKLTHSTL